MREWEVNQIIDMHIDKYRKILENYDVGDENETISNCNRIINELNQLKKEVKLLDMIQETPTPLDVVDILEEVNVNEDFLRLVSNIILDD